VGDDVWAANGEGGIRIWSFDKGSVLMEDITVDDCPGKILHMILLSSATYNEVWAGCSDNKIRIFYPSGSKKATVIQTLNEHEDQVTALIEENAHVWSGSLDGTIRVINKYKKRCIKIIDCTMVGSIASLQLVMFAKASSAGQKQFNDQDLDKFIWVGGDQRIARFNATTFEHVSTEYAHQGLIHSLQIVDNKIWSASSDKMIGILDPFTGELIEMLAGHMDIVYCLLPVGDNVWTCSKDKTILVWNKKSRDCISIFSGYHSGAISHMALVNAPTESQVWSASDDATISLFSLA